MKERNLLILWVLVLIVLLMVGCGRAPDLTVKSEKNTVLPSERIELIADVSNLYNGTYVSRYYWSIITPDCGDLSCINCRTTTWTAPAEAPQPRICKISAEVFLRDRSHSYYEESTTLVFDKLVVPYPVKNQPPVITLFNVPLQFVSPDETVSLSVEAMDPEGGPLKYYWTASCGRISGSGTGVSWTAPSKAPASGKCAVHVSVEDQERAATGTSAEFVVK